MPRIDFGALVENRPLKKTLVHFHFAVTKTPHFEMAILHDDADLVYILCASHVYNYNNNIKLEIVWSFVEWLAHSQDSLSLSLEYVISLKIAVSGWR